MTSDPGAVVIALDEHGGLGGLPVVLKAAAPRPVVVLTDDPDLQVAAVRLGAADAVPPDDAVGIERAARLAVVRATTRREVRLADDVRSPSEQDPLLVLDADNVVIEANHRVEALLGWGLEDLRGRTPLWLLRPEDREYFLDFMAGRSGDVPRAIQVRRRDDGWCWMRFTVLHGQRGSRRFLVGEDVTEARAEREELRVRALTDPLTGLLNRGALVAAMTAALTRSEVVSVLFGDVDDFKGINDTHGHLVGDAVLRGVASTLRHVARDGLDLICRYAGDEFVVVLQDTTGEQADAVAERITSALAEPMDCEGVAVQVSLSIGRATAEDGTTSVTDLLEAADQDLYRHKRART